MPNGAFVETVLEIAADRLRYYQASPFACEENAIALDHVECAIGMLEARTARRERQGVEGTHGCDGPAAATVDACEVLTIDNATADQLRSWLRAEQEAASLLHEQNHHMRALLRSFL